jgi:hypothetical protein
MIKVLIHKITALFLVSMLLTNSINTVAIIGDFIVNQDFIAKTLCIQKEEQKGCNGKCQLRKQLVENNSETNSNIPLPENKRTSLDIYCLFTIDALNMHLSEFTLPKVNLSHDSTRIYKTALEVETPPPIFS